MKTVEEVKRELRDVIMNACDPLGPQGAKREIRNDELIRINHDVEAYLIAALDVTKKY